MGNSSQRLWCEGRLINERQKIMRISKIAIFFLVFMIGGSAWAHYEDQDRVSFISGLLHPFSGFDHMIAIIMIGYWSAFAIKRSLYGPISFIVGVVIGMFLGLFSLRFSLIELGIGASVVGIGILVLLQKRFNSDAVLGLIALFGLFHGFAHAEFFALNLTYDVNLIIVDLLGLLIATGILHAIGLFIAKLAKDKNKIFTKLSGIATLVYGLFLLSLASY